MEEQELWYFLFRGGGKNFYNVFSDMIFYLRILQKFWVSKTIPVPICLVCFDDLAQLLPLKPVAQKYMCALCDQ